MFDSVPEHKVGARKSRLRTSFSSAAFFVLSLLLHAAVLFGFALGSIGKPLLELKLPPEIELGVLDPNPGAEGAPPPAAPPAPTKPATKPKAAKEPKPDPTQEGTEIVVDAGVHREAVAPDAAVGDAQASQPAAAVDENASGNPALAGGDGNGVQGSGLGFGAGGFGTGHGGPLGAVIGLHADLEVIRSTSLVLEARALLQLIPEWPKLLQGSGISPLRQLSRIFVATPNLTRSALVVSARFKGGEAFVAQAAQRLAQERGTSASFSTQGALRVAPWYSHGPTERQVALVAPDQLVIARPKDLPRVLAVSAALARRHQKQPEMEKAVGAAALLAMYEGEAAALSVEGAREFVVGDNGYIPIGLRISLRFKDEFHAGLRVFGYYESEKSAADALDRIEGLRHDLAHHPQATFLGLTSAIDEAELERKGDTLVLEAELTLHQTRYLLGFVAHALEPRD